MKYLYLGPIFNLTASAVNASSLVSYIIFGLFVAAILAFGLKILIEDAIELRKNTPNANRKKKKKTASSQNNQNSKRGENTASGFAAKPVLKSQSQTAVKPNPAKDGQKDLNQIPTKSSTKIEYDPAVPYFVKTETTLSPGEQYFISILSPLIDPTKYHIVTQAQYSKYLKPNPNTSKEQQAISASKIKALRGDFAIETQDYRPVMLIEYNDKSHKEEDRIIRDNYLHKACKYAQLPRLPVESSHFNSYIFKSEFEARKRLYVLLSLNGNVLCLPDIVCAKCGREFDVITGKFGAFLAHYRDESCHQTVNIFSAKKC